MPQAIERRFERAVKLRPAYVDAGNRLAWLRATWPEASLRNAGEAVAEAERANQLCGGRQRPSSIPWPPPMPRRGGFPEAVATVRKALALATQQGSAAVLNGIQGTAGPLRSRPALSPGRLRPAAAGRKP